MKKLVVLAAIAFLQAPLAHATLYEYSAGAGGFGNGGTFDSIFASYDDGSGMLTWEVDNALKDITNNGINDPLLMDGFWLVLNDGPNNPKGDDGLAIFYADFNADSLWAYEYNGQNNPLSYAGAPLLDFFTGLTNSGTTRGFTVDVTNIYSQLSTQGPFDDQIGIWFHPTWGTDSIGDDGGLESWEFLSQSWYDRSGKNTTVVSEPTALALLAMGLLGLAFSRRK